MVSYRYRSTVKKQYIELYACIYDIPGYNFFTEKQIYISYDFSYMILQVKYLYKSALYECIYKFPSDLIQKGVIQHYNDMKMDNLFLLLIHFIFMLIGEYYWVRKT